MRSWLLALCLVVANTATIGGNVAPDGKTEVQCDFPPHRHRKNITSMGEGCCVWTSIHHAADWQNVPAYQEAPRWVQEKRMRGAAHAGMVSRYLPQMAKERGHPEAPPVLIYEGYNYELLKLACSTGRMPAVTYTHSPAGRYQGQRIAHMVSLVHADDRWVAILDSNYVGENQLEWMTPQQFRASYTALDGGWCVILLAPPPPPPPKNQEETPP